ncbi:hypothetical protein D3C75_662900 [compost metagenome]
MKTVGMGEIAAEGLPQLFIPLDRSIGGQHLGIEVEDFFDVVGKIHVRQQIGINQRFRELVADGNLMDFRQPVAHRICGNDSSAGGLRSAGLCAGMDKVAGFILYINQPSRLQLLISAENS